MSYTEILVLICLCIFVVVLLYITVQLTKGINLQIRTCGKMAKWAKQELERKEEKKMSDLISRQDAIDAINHICPIDTEYDCTLLDRVDVRCVLSELPSAERKRGEWHEYDRPYHLHCCRNCGEDALFTKDGQEVLSNYCAFCGADMRGDEDEC